MNTGKKLVRDFNERSEHLIQTLELVNEEST